MARFPFFNFPYPYHYYNYNKNYNLQSLPSDIENIKPNIEKIENEDRCEDKQIKDVQKRGLPISFNFNGVNDNSEPIIELLGISLYLDDLIILGLLFILYNEKVKDDMLFICLILLLLS